MNFSRGSLILDCLRKFSVKDVEGVEQELQRMYNFVIPLNATFEEVYGVLTELISDIKKLEEEEKAKKEAAEKAAAEKAAAEQPAESVEATLTGDVN